MGRSINNFDDRSGDVQSSDFVIGYRPSAKGSRFQLSALVSWLQSQLSSVFAGASHSHPATGISDSTATGRAVLTSADQAAARTAVGAAAAAHTHSPDDIGQGTALDGYILMWSSAANKWVPTPYSSLTSVQLLDEDGDRLIDEDLAVLLDEGF